MIRFSPRSLQCAVVGGKSVCEALSGWDEGDWSLGIERIAAGDISDLSNGGREWDCVVLECSNSSTDTISMVERCRTDQSKLPVVLLVDDWSSEATAKALAMDRITALPRTLVDTNPAGLADQVASAVQNGYAQTSFREFYDNISGPVTLHDPDSGEMVHANQSLCDLLGYERSELLAMQVGDFTADIPGYDHDRAMNLVRSATGRDDPIEVEWPLATVDGRVRWAESQLRPVQIGGRELVLSTAVDITERRRQERKYEQVFDNVNDVITVHDPWNEEIVDVNETLCELTGYSREGLLEMDIDGFSATGEGYTSDRAYEIQQRVAATGEVDTVEWKILTADGGERLLEAVLSPATIAGEDRVLVLARDITERKRREREYEQIFNGVQDGILLIDSETLDILDANDAYLDLAGYDSLEAIQEKGVSGLSVTAEGYTIEEGRKIHRRVAESRTPEIVEWRMETKSGDRRWLEVKLTPARVGDEAVNIAVHRDITERKRQQREYEQIFNSVHDAIVVHDPETGEMVDVNDSMCALLGYDRETVLELGTDGISVTEEGYTEERANEIIAEGMAGEGPNRFEWKVETSDGEHRVMEVRTTSAEIGGERRHVSINRDVTARRRREREFEQIFNNVHDIISINDPETGEIRQVNDTMCDLLGYERDEVLELGVDGISAEGFTRADAKEFFDTVAESEAPQQTTWAVETSDGETRWLEVDATLAEIGGESRFITANRDITERKRREREYEQIFNGVNDAISIQHPETGELLDANDTFCELLGYERQELLDMGIEGFSPSSLGFTMEQAREFVRSVVESDEPKQTEWAGETSDGEIRWFEVHGTTAEIGGNLRYISIARDITELRRTERRLREILDRIDEAILMTRPDTLTVDPRSAEYVSSGHEGIWGQSFEDIREKHDDGILGTIHVDDVEEYQAYVEGIVADISNDSVADNYSIEYRIERPDGQTRWVQSDYYPIDWERKQTRIVIVSRDITDRKSRQQRIAAFDDATAELATADTPEEATKTAVDAATETLQLRTVGVFLYDNDSGVLRPETLSGPIPDPVDTGPIKPGGNPLWEAFATGTTVASDGGRPGNGSAGDENQPPEALSDLEGWRALALGNHGLLLVGSPTGTLDSETLQSAHVLAATLEAALNHLQGQQEIAAQEAQLQSQTQQIERLDRIARLTQQVEAAITDASTPGEIEQAICERLASSGPYALAWIGGLDVGSDQLTPHAVVGAADQYVERLQLKTTSETADPHPALAAWRRDELHVTDSIVGDGPADNWRQEALAEGHQSLCAVPLTYDGITHGVLTVGTDSPGEFGDREREVLSQLGTAIGNAIAAIERRRALESDETIELEFRGSGDALPFAQVAEQIGCQVRHERTVARQDSSLSVYYKMKGEFADDKLDSVRQSFRGTVEIVTDDSSTLVEVKTENWFGSPLAEYGGVLREAVADPDETTLTVEVPRQADVRSFTERLQAEAPSLELAAKRQHRRQNKTPAELHDHIRTELTDRQFEVLQTAVSAGYFEWPRDNDGSDIAESLDITQPTVNKHLRLAEKQIFSLLMESAE